MAKDITERPVFPVSARSSASARYLGESGLADVTIGGLPFQLSCTDERPYVRQTLDFRKQQLDTSSEPGEQTLSQWWTRQQDSWHRGAGIQWYEPGSDPYTIYRFHSSAGVDVWTPGQITLLRKMGATSIANSGESVGCAAAVRSGVNGVYFTLGGAFGWEYGSMSGPTFFSTGGYDTATDPVIAGSKVIYGCTGGVAAAAIGSETVSLLWTFTAGNVVRPWWVKSRIIAARDNSLYDLSLAGGSFPTALYSHPDSSWEWTAVTETPDAILAAGKSSGYSVVYAFTLSPSGSPGSVPVLGPATVVAEFPPGEEVYSLKGYLGTFVAIGTTRGVRIATVGQGGQMQYGPLTIETTNPVYCLAARDSFVYAGLTAEIDGRSGCARINLAEEITSQVNGISNGGASTLRFAWTYDVDLQGNTEASIGNKVQSISFYGTTGEVTLGVYEAGLFVMNPNTHVPSGYVVSGKVRFATAEPKSFQRLKLRAEIPGDSGINVATIDQGGSETSILSMTAGFSGEDIGLPSVSEVQQSHIAVKLTLSSSSPDSDTGVSLSPVIQTVQLKALPNPAVQRELVFPVRLHDVEQDRNGVSVGYEGSAFDRLQELEELENTKKVVTVQDNTNGESFSAYVRRVRLVRTTAPARMNKNFGGELSIEVVRL